MLTALSEAVKRHLQTALVLALCSVPLQCATLERLSLNDMISQSAAIIRGKVTGSYAAFGGTTASPVIYTHYSVQVSEWLKGSGGNTVDLAVPGGIVNNVRQTFSGSPTFKMGDECVFFLWTSKAGMTQVIGLTQGLFSLAQDGSADPMATRSPSNELMLDRTTGQPVKDQQLLMHLSELRSAISTTLGTHAQTGVK
ncbi:MAG TPA: hypothetical protein VKU19_01410 [Bryobacteraceae bacterium]|nr:hypothetical protein [Bryobacteraceae bacterium]